MMQMNYERFKKEVVTRMKEYMPEEFQSMNLNIQVIPRVNQTKEGLAIVQPTLMSEPQISPNIYLDDLYEQYLQIGDIEICVREAAELMVKCWNKKPTIELDDRIRGRIVYRLINTKKNVQLLEKAPHREWCDLSIVYYWLIDQIPEGMASALIQYPLAENLGLNEEQLYELASKNTKELLPADIIPIGEFLKKIEEKEVMPEGIPAAHIDMYVVTNQKREFGAIATLYADGLYELAESLGADLYILPSSLHETIIVSAEMDLEYLSKMVKEINANEVDIIDWLSDTVYFYSRQSKEITIAAVGESQGSLEVNFVAV